MGRKDGQPAGAKPEEPNPKIQKRPPALAAAASGALSGALISASVQVTATASPASPGWFLLL